MLYGYRSLLIPLLHFDRNNSARGLSAFAESAMAVNRVFQQHFSMNIDMVPKHSVETANLSNKQGEAVFRHSDVITFAYDFKTSNFFPIYFFFQVKYSVFHRQANQD